MSGRRIAIIAFEVPIDKQNQALTCFKYYFETNFGEKNAKLIGVGAGRPHRAAYAIIRQLIDKQYMIAGDLFGMLSYEVLHFYKLVKPFDPNKIEEEKT